MKGLRPQRRGDRARGDRARLPRKDLQIPGGARRRVHPSCLAPVRGIQRRVPRGPRLSQRLAELFDSEPLMDRFRKRFDVRYYTPIRHSRGGAARSSYRDWGGTASPPPFGDINANWSGRPHVERVRCHGATRSPGPGPHGHQRSARSDVRRCRTPLLGRRRTRSTWSTGACRRTRWSRVPTSAGRSSTPTAAAPSASPKSLRCKTHDKKATFFANLTDDRFAHLFTEEQRAVVSAHVPWTRVVRDTGATRDGTAIDLAAHLRRHRDSVRAQAERRYGGTGVTLGWETDERAWDEAIAARAPGIGTRVDCPGSGSPSAARRSRSASATASLDADDAGFRAVSVPRPRGRLPDAAERHGTRQRTSGGGQVPAFIVESRDRRA